MGVYRRTDSPWYWMSLERPGLPRLRLSTGVPVDAPDAMSRKLQRQQAEVVYNARMTDLARGRLDLPALEPASMTVATFARWYDVHVVAKHKGRERERLAVAKLLPALGHLELRDVRPTHVAEYETARLAETVRPSTVNREVAVLKAMLSAAVREGHLDASPLAGRKHLASPKRPKRTLTYREEQRLLAELQPADRVLFILAVDTLIRLSNVLSLTRAECKGTYLALTDSKTGPYQVPLSTRARRALAAHLKTVPPNQPYVFPHRRTARTDRDRRGVIRRMLARACARAGLPYGRAVGGVTFHTATRASGATRMLRAQVDLRTVQRIGHWSSMEQMVEYLETDDRTMRAAVNRIGKA